HRRRQPRDARRDRGARHPRRCDPGESERRRRRAVPAGRRRDGAAPPARSRGTRGGRIHRHLRPVAWRRGAGTRVRVADRRRPIARAARAVADDRRWRAARRGRADPVGRRRDGRRGVHRPRAAGAGAVVSRRVRPARLSARAQPGRHAVLRISDEAVRVHGHGARHRRVGSRADRRNPRARSHRVAGAAGRRRRARVRNPPCDRRRGVAGAARRSGAVRGACAVHLARAHAPDDRESARDCGTMTRLLAVSWEMPPMYGPRGMQVAAALRELPALGWQPTVVCLAPRRGGPHWRSGDDREPVPGVEYRRVASPQDWWIVRSARRIVPALRDRPDPARLWVSPATRAAVDAARNNRYGALITFAQPWSDHLVGLRVQRATGLPWVAHFSDPWAASPYATAAQRARWRPMEAEVIRCATSVVFVTAEAADSTMAAYPDEWRRKAAIVPHGYDPRSTPPSGGTGSRARLRLVYTGRFYSGIRTPLSLLHALATVT